MEKYHHNEKNRKKLNVHRIAVICREDCHLYAQETVISSGSETSLAGHRIMALKVLCKYFH